MATVDAIAKRYHPLIVGGLLLAIAYFQASGITSLIAEQIPAAPHTKDSTAAAEDALARVKSGGAQRTKSGAEILARNAFDSATGPLGTKVNNTPPPLATTPPARPSGAAGSQDAPKCTSGQVTMVVGALDPAYSFAVITTNNQSRMRRIGDDVDGKKIESIHGESVILSTDEGSRCRLAMHEAGSPIDLGKGSTAKSAEGAEPAETKGAPGGIRKVSDTEFIIERDAAQKLTQMKQALSKTAKVVDGQGLRLYRHAQTTVLDKLGLKKGDVLKTINGYDLSSLDQQTEAYAKLPTFTSMQIVVERDGKPMTIDYTIAAK